MIARVWKGSTSVENADRYVTHLRDSVFPELASIDGHVGAYVLERRGAAAVDFTVITLWASMEAIHAFAGPDAEVAVVPPRAQALLATREARATHFDVVLSQ